MSTLLALSENGLPATAVRPGADAPSESEVAECVVADDHPVVLGAICDLLETHGLTIAARAGDGLEALAQIDRRKPRIAVVDLGLPGVHGIEATRRAAVVSPRTAVVIFTGQVDAGRALDALDAGARGVVLKEAPLEDLVRAARVALAGGVYIDPTLVSSIVDSSYTRLTDHERALLRLAAEGLTNEEIGARFFLSGQTVRKNLTAVMRKLEVSNRTAAVATALRRQIIF